MDSNDLEYLKAAGLGIAMKNAYSSIQQIADRVTTHPNTHDGVAHELEELMTTGVFRSY